MKRHSRQAKHRAEHAVRHGHRLIHERDHIGYWAQLVGTVCVPDAESGASRALAFNHMAGKFTLLADQWVEAITTTAAIVRVSLEVPYQFCPMFRHSNRQLTSNHRVGHTAS